MDVFEISDAELLDLAAETVDALGVDMSREDVAFCLDLPLSAVEDFADA